jgi:hypothetical protein
MVQDTLHTVQYIQIYGEAQPGGLKAKYLAQASEYILGATASLAWLSL